MNQKNALVTGGNSGIGYATARLLQQKGYAVSICGRDPERVARAAEALGVVGIVADMGNLAQVQALAAQLVDKPLHALVNNAAIARFMPLSQATGEDFDEFININLRGPLELIKALLPALTSAGGSITNVSSAVVNNGLPNAALYAATKGALEAATKSLALELAPKGIRINAVAPGAIDTGISGKYGLDPEVLRERKAKMAATIPLQRYGSAEEVAEVILAQLESTYTTGAIWRVDGGVNAT
jgi:NAD(P)-dependent dehydrogenase (short-subunit alcohol dehydrogenase family)